MVRCARWWPFSHVGEQRHRQAPWSTGWGLCCPGVKSQGQQQSSYKRPALFWDNTDTVWAMFSMASLKSLCWKERTLLLPPSQHCHSVKRGWMSDMICCLKNSWTCIFYQFEDFGELVIPFSFDVNAKWAPWVLLLSQNDCRVNLNTKCKGSGCSPRKHLSLVSWITESKPWLIFLTLCRGKFCHHITHITFQMNLVIVICFGLASFRLKPCLSEKGNHKLNNSKIRYFWRIISGLLSYQKQPKTVL